MGRVILTGLVLFLCVITCCGAETNGGASLISDSALVATVNGEPVICREFMLLARSQRSRVINEYLHNHGGEYGSDFWSRNYNGKTPMDVLKKRTLDTIVSIKIQEICARQAGLVDDISYRGFLKALEAENHRRLVAKQTGKVIYGPVQYSEEVYYNYLFSNLVNNLKENLAGSVFSITDEKLKATYERQKDSLYRKGFITEVRLVKLEHGMEKAGDDKGKAMQKAETVLVFNDSVYVPEEEDPFRLIVRETAGKMAVGQSSQPIEFQGTFYIVHVKNRISLGFRNFESCKTAVRMVLLDRMYDQYIRGLVNQAACLPDKDVYEQIHY